MDHEILFRGKRVNNREWATSVCPCGIMCCGTITASFIPDTVGQYTGLTDKNGVKIFGGDILRSRYDEGFPEDVTIEVVLWASNGWCTKTIDGDLCPLEDDGVLPYSEVVGNIHDNPELLGENTAS